MKKCRVLPYPFGSYFVTFVLSKEKTQTFSEFLQLQVQRDLIRMQDYSHFDYLLSKERDEGDGAQMNRTTMIVVAGDREIPCPTCWHDLRGSMLDDESRSVACKCGAIITEYFFKSMIPGSRFERLSNDEPEPYIWRPMVPCEVIDLRPRCAPNLFKRG